MELLGSERHRVEFTASPTRAKSAGQPSQFRWEDQFNLSLDPETAREFHDEWSRLG